MAPSPAAERDSSNERSPVVVDVAGTILELACPVGELYAGSARAAGADLDPTALHRGFQRAFAAAPPLAFGEERDPARREAAERAWWRTVAVRAAREAGAPDGFDLDRFFDHAWHRFAGPEPWRVPDDARPGLRALRRAGHPLVAFSNWDSRLPALLRAVGLEGYFARIHVSSGLPAAKPDPEAFAHVEGDARDLGGGVPVMIGDRLDHDVEPALERGWRAIWLDRGEGGGAVPDGAVRVSSMVEAAAAVTGRRHA